MTNNEAIEWQRAFKKTYRGMPKESDEACELAINALEEIQHYQSIGTVLECQENKKFLEFLYDAINPNEMEKYASMYHAGNTGGITL